LYKACWIESDNPEELEAFKKRKYQYMAKDREGNKKNQNSLVKWNLIFLKSICAICNT